MEKDEKLKIKIKSEDWLELFFSFYIFFQIPNIPTILCKRV